MPVTFAISAMLHLLRQGENKMTDNALIEELLIVCEHARAEIQYLSCLIPPAWGISMALTVETLAELDKVIKQAERVKDV